MIYFSVGGELWSMSEASCCTRQNNVGFLLSSHCLVIKTQFVCLQSRAAISQVNEAVGRIRRSLSTIWNKNIIIIINTLKHLYFIVVPQHLQKTLRSEVLWKVEEVVAATTTSFVQELLDCYCPGISRTSRRRSRELKRRRGTIGNFYLMIALVLCHR